MKITEPGVYDIPEAEYHADNFLPTASLSSSLAKVLLEKSPRHCWLESARLNPNHAPLVGKEFDIGKAAHALMLGDVQRFDIIDEADFRTKAAREARDAAYHAGRIPLLRHKLAEVEAMVMAARAQLREHERRDAFTDGKPEQTLVWQEGDVWCRCRLDWMPNKGATFDDFKTTSGSANPETVTRQIFSLSYDVQAAFYMRGIRAVLAPRNPQFEFVFCEVEPPHGLSVVGFPPAVMDLADRKVAEAIRLWRWCLRNNQWPIYPARTVYVEMPVWAEKSWLDREARDALDAENGEHSMYERLVRWQAPINGDAA